MHMDSRDMVSVTDASRNVSQLVRDAEAGRHVVIMKSNTPAAVIIGKEDFERLQRIDEAEQDLRLLALTTVRLLTDSGNRHSVDDVAAELGVDLGED